MKLDRGDKMDYSKEPQIFLSYCWRDKDEVDRIDQFLLNRNIIFNRDNRIIEDWGSIRLYMDSIKNTDYAVLIISDNYLKSINCMYEIVELMKDEEYSKRIMPVVLDNRIYDISKRTKYIKFWENKYTELDREIRKINNFENATEITRELKRVKQICLTIDEFLAIIGDLNNPAIESVCDSILQKLKGKHVKLYERIEGLNEFLKCLDRCKYIETALSPENPYGEDKYLLQKYDIDSDIHGLSVKFYLKNILTDEEFRLIIPDIEKIEKSTYESYKHNKFYFYCLDRIAINKYNDFIEMKKVGMESDPQKEFELSQQTCNKHRCILLY